MSRHVPPHRWADAVSGLTTDAELAAMDRHAESCERCAKTKARIARASESFHQMRTQSAPELSWDEVRARVYWNVSTERHAKVRAPGTGRRVAGWTMGAGLVGAAVALAIATGPLQPMVGGEATNPAVAVAPANGVMKPTPPAPVVAPAPIIGIVNRATGDVMIDGILANDLFTRRLAAGTTVTTGNGSVDVQFGPESAFALGPRSLLELRKLDAETIELAVEGMVDVTVAPRQGSQKFLVHAGDRTIEVRGTQFRIRHDAKATFVACHHGLVAVRDAKGTIELPASRRVEVPAGQAVASGPIGTLTVDELAALAAATPMTLGAWGNLDALLAGSAPLEIAAGGRREVRVDGVELGNAPLRVRMLPGRHTVEVADSAGRYRRAGWVDVAAPSAGKKPARLEIAADPPPTRGTHERRRELSRGIDKAHLGRCTRKIAKAGLTNTYVQIEISVDANGSVPFLNVIDTDLPSETANCVRDALLQIEFGKGADAKWVERIDL